MSDEYDRSADVRSADARSADARSAGRQTGRSADGHVGPVDDRCRTRFRHTPTPTSASSAANVMARPFTNDSGQYTSRIVCLPFVT